MLNTNIDIVEYLKVLNELLYTLNSNEVDQHMFYREIAYTRNMVLREINIQMKKLK